MELESCKAPPHGSDNGVSLNRNAQNITKALVTTARWRSGHGDDQGLNTLQNRKPVARSNQRHRTHMLVDQVQRAGINPIGSTGFPF